MSSGRLWCMAMQTQAKEKAALMDNLRAKHHRIMSMFSFVWAKPIKSFGHVAVMAKNLKTSRVLVAFQPLIDRSLDLLSMLSSPAVDVVNSKKFNMRLSTTGAAKGFSIVTKSHQADTTETVSIIVLVFGKFSSFLPVLRHAVFTPTIDAILVLGWVSLGKVFSGLIDVTAGANSPVVINMS